MLKHISKLHSFLRMSNSLMYVCGPLKKIDGHLGCFYPLAIVHNAALNTGVQECESLLSIPLNIHLEVELLDHVVILFNFVRNQTVSPQWLHISYFHWQYPAEYCGV